jgi:hypothetical protein
VERPARRPQLHRPLLHTAGRAHQPHRAGAVPGGRNRLRHPLLPPDACGLVGHGHQRQRTGIWPPQAQRQRGLAAGAPAERPAHAAQQPALPGRPQRPARDAQPGPDGRPARHGTPGHGAARRRTDLGHGHADRRPPPDGCRLAPVGRGLRLLPLQARLAHLLAQRRRGAAGPGQPHPHRAELE